MRTTRLFSVIAACWIVGGLCPCASAVELAVPLPGQAIDSGVFELHEMDMHLHAGMERPVPMQAWLDYAIADGRKVIVLLDHLELYRQSPEEYEAWRAERGFDARYPTGREGHLALMKDFDEARAARRDAIIFKGWEVYEGELDDGSEPEALDLAEVIGWHISPNNGGEAPGGAQLIHRAKQIKELQQRHPVPMILFHPFTMRLENIQRTAQKDGKDVASLSVDDYRFFKPGEQEELAELLRGSSIYIEISNSTGRYWEDPVAREALIADIKPLAELGVQFTVSTDNHGVESAERTFRPDYAALGITPQNTNTIVRELLVIRARGELADVAESAKP